MEKRVLQILSSLNIGSGLANFVMNYYRLMRREGVIFDFLLFGRATNEYYEEVIGMGSKVYIIEKPTLHTLVQYRKRIESFFREHAKEYLALHLHVIQIQSVILRAGRKAGVANRIVHAHNTGNIGWLKSARDQLLMLGVKGNASHFLACSEQAGIKIFGRKIISQANYYVVKNAIDGEKYRFDDGKREEIRKRLGFLPQDRVIGHIGRFCKEKNHAFLLQLFANIQIKDGNAKLLLVGDGPLREEFMAKASAWGLEDHIVYTGNILNVHEILNAMDLFVLPSVMEGLGIVLVEAQANGLTCIASDGVPREADISGKVDFLSLQAPLENWTRKVEQLLCLPRYDGLERVRASGYDLAQNVNLLKQIYLG